MNLIECVKMAVSSIKANKMRSLLTMLGIIIGISAVIIITTIGGSVKATMNNAFNSFGMNYFYGWFTPKEYTEDVYDKLEADDLPTLQMYYDLVEKYPDQFEISVNDFYCDGKVLNQKNDYQNISLRCTTSGYFSMTNKKLAEGRFLTLRDDLEKKSVAVVSETFAKKYCGNSSIINKPITIVLENGEEAIFYVVGVYKNNSSDVEQSSNQKTNIYVPYQCYLNPQDIHATYVTVVWNPDMGIDSAKENFTRFFENIYHSNEYWHVEVDEYDQEMLGTINVALNILTIAFSVIAAISLLVGGIGVMNIMLVSIVERTSEIGVRKALGAQNSSIRIQFVMEAIMICIIGSIIGILIGLGFSYLLGFVGSYVVTTVVPEYADVVDVTVKPSVIAIIISVLSSILIGVTFGFYPANRAAKMNPIDALRHE